MTSGKEGYPLSHMISDASMVVEVLAFELPDSPTLASVLVEVRRCGDKALIIHQPQYSNR